MPRKNYSLLIKDKQQRRLTAKGNKFVWNCIKVLATVNNTSPYDNRGSMKDKKSKLRSILYYLIIDQELSIEAIKQMIEDRHPIINPLEKPQNISQ